MSTLFDCSVAAADCRCCGVCEDDEDGTWPLLSVVGADGVVVVVLINGLLDLFRPAPEPTSASEAG